MSGAPIPSHQPTAAPAARAQPRAESWSGRSGASTGTSSTEALICPHSLLRAGEPPVPSTSRAIPASARPSQMWRSP